MTDEGPYRTPTDPGDLAPEAPYVPLECEKCEHIRSRFRHAMGRDPEAAEFATLVARAERHEHE